MLLLKGLGKLPNFTRFLHVDNMDVHLLTTSRWNPGPRSLGIGFPTSVQLTVFPDSVTMTFLASSARSLFLHTMWTVPPGNTHTHTHVQEAPQSAMCAGGARPQPTFVCHSHGGRSADATVGSSDHEGPSHHRHVQVLSIEAFRCRFISLPEGADTNL